MRLIVQVLTGGSYLMMGVVDRSFMLKLAKVTQDYLSRLALHGRGIYFDILPRLKYKEPSVTVELSYKLETLGFVDQAYADLFALANGRLGRITGFAIWHLLLWTIRSPSSPLTPPEFKSLILRGLACPLPRELHFQLRLMSLLAEAKTKRSKTIYRHVRWLTFCYGNRAADYLFTFLIASDDEREKAGILKLIFRSCGLSAPGFLPPVKGLPLFDRLEGPSLPICEIDVDDCPLVSIIIACYNSAEIIETALRSLLAQTWANIEIIVVDDCSTDGTANRVEAFASQRIKLLRMPSNSGAYAARNAALAICRGDYITLHDADDWSYPSKLEFQALFLLRNPNFVACTTRRVRISENLDQLRLSSRGWIVGLNTSSVMIRREALIDLFHGWDDVRYAADTELFKRIQSVLGKSAIKHLQSSPLTFQRLTDISASSVSKTGYPGFAFGTRHIYAKSYDYYHAKRSHPFPFPPFGPDIPERPFLAPGIMQSTREINPHYSVIIASEFRMKGGSTRSSIEELKVQQHHGIPSAVVPMYRYDLNPSISEVEMLYDNLDPSRLRFICCGEQASCDLLIIRYPPVLAHWQDYLPCINAKQVFIIVNQPPFSDYGPKGVKRYDIQAANRNAIRWLGVEPTWYPIGPLVRDALHLHHHDDLPHIRLASQDWSNIIDLSSWRLRDRVPCHTTPDAPLRIGRHSRDESLKWIERRESLLQVYPVSRQFEVHVLGGAKSVKRMLGGSLPGNWTVYEFGSIDPRDFLAGLDFFVYYTNSGWVESFGRVIIEAMAIGVPVILPSHYKRLFLDAALFAEPRDVQGVIRELASDHVAYNEQVTRARAFVQHHFSHHTHLARLNECGVSSCS